MKQMNPKLLERKIKKHQDWLIGESASQPDFCGASLRGIELPDSDLPYIDFSKSDLTGVVFYGANLEYADFRNAILDEVDFREANLKGARFNKASAKRADFRGAYFEDTDFSKANLEDAKIEKGAEENCNFSGANLTGTSLDPGSKKEVFYLEERDGEVHLMFTKNEDSHLLLTITREGKLRRAKNLPQDLGFDLDSEGRIRLFS